jgi:D-alanine-D-alanine ligase
VRITVLMGGTSSERDVSLASGLRIADALRKRGHTVTTVDTVRGALSAGEEQTMLAGRVMHALPPDPGALARLSRETLPATVRGFGANHETDVVFIGLHGGQGEDGTLDKDLSKRLFREAGVRTPEWLMTPASDDEIIAALSLPVIVKPSKQGSTVGLTLVKDRAGLQPAIAEALKYDDEVMIERFIAGRELTVGILGDEALPVGEIIPEHEIYDYECKYTPGMAREEFPAKLSVVETKAVQEQARLAFRALKLSGCARIDFRMTADGTFYCLEANTLPGMTELSLIPQAAAAAGITFPELCERIVQLAKKVRPKDSGETR